jgi:uncharacterized protein (TIGR02217 family)
MTLQVDPDRLPTYVEMGAEFALTTETAITPSFGGNESRYARRRARVEATLTVGPEHAREVLTLFRAQIGSRYAFTCRDWSDYQATDEELTLDSNGDYPLIVTYATNTRSEIRRILLPDAIVVSGNGTPLVLNTDYSLSDGIVHPLTSLATPVTWTGTFNIPVRFADDQLRISLPVDGSTLIAQQFRIIEVLG